MTPDRRNFVNFLAVCALLVFVVACSCPTLRESGISTSESSETDNSDTGTNEEKTEVSGEQKRKTDRGDFVVEHLEVKNRKYQSIDSSFRENKVLEKAADKLNRSLILPTDIILRTKECGQINAFYDPKEESITFCYELMEHFFLLFKSVGNNNEQANKKMNDAITFVFLHELGHALIDLYELPITGNEEDAADRCSSFICIEELGDSGVRSVVAAAEAFAIESKISKPNRRNMADEHLLQEQRFFNSLCMIYGSNPEKYSEFKKDTLLPEARAVRCPADYTRIAKSWTELLKPWRKD